MTDFDFDTQKIDDLIHKVKNSGIYKIKLKCEEFEIEIQTTPAQTTFTAPVQQQTVSDNHTVQVSQASHISPEQEISGNIIKSPIIGTFYAAPAPDKPPFVNVGDCVKKGDVLFIIESMKLMNEIKSEYDGTVKKILVESGEGVEYHQPILVIE